MNRVIDIELEPTKNHQCCYLFTAKQKRGTNEAKKVMLCK